MLLVQFDRLLWAGEIGLVFYSRLISAIMTKIASRSFLAITSLSQEGAEHHMLRYSS